MNAIQYTLLLGWLSFVSARKLGLGDICMHDIDCFSQNCIPECETNGSIFRCVEPKSFFLHLSIEGSCVSEYDTRMLGQFSESSLRLGEQCENHDSCESGSCVPICEANSILRCIEPVYSFSRHNKPIPQCISERASSDHLKLLSEDNAYETEAQSESFAENISRDNIAANMMPNTANEMGIRPEPSAGIISPEITQGNVIPSVVDSFRSEPTFPEIATLGNIIPSVVDSFRSEPSVGNISPEMTQGNIVPTDNIGVNMMPYTAIEAGIRSEPSAGNISPEMTQGNMELDSFAFNPSDIKYFDERAIEQSPSNKYLRKPVIQDNIIPEKAPIEIPPTDKSPLIPPRHINANYLYSRSKLIRMGKLN